MNEMNMSSKTPPSLPKYLLSLCIQHDDEFNIVDTLRDLYCYKLETDGKRKADIWYWRQVLGSIPKNLCARLIGRFVMIKNYLKMTIRNLKKHASYSFINISGLGLGMACTILILLWVQDELSFDRFHEKAGRLYRVADREEYSNGDVLYFSTNPPNLGPSLKEDFPEVINSARYRSLRGRVINLDDHVFYEDNFAAADPSLFEMFSFPFVQGNMKSVLSDPHGIVISQSTARKYFGSTDPLGQHIRVDNRFDLHVTGVFRDIPSNSHLRFDFVIPFESIEEFGYPLDTWGYFAFKTYVELSDKSSVDVLNEKIRNFIKQYDETAIVTLSLQPVTDIHLFCRAYGDAGDIRTVILFTVIAGIVLLTACINFMNLSTARSGGRALEIGLRKVVGAKRREIIAQFYGDTLILTLLSLVIALILVYFSLPWFNTLAGKTLSLNLGQNAALVLILLGTLLITSLVAGSYPALFLSSFQPVKVLRGTLKAGAKSSVFRRVLVTVQFFLTITLIIGTLVLNRQMHFMRHFKLGYNQDQVLTIGLKGDLERKREILKAEFQKIPGVSAISAVSDLPTRLSHSRILSDWEGRDSDDNFLIHVLMADHGLAHTLQMEMTEGRYFSHEIPTDTSEGIVVNETAVRFMGMDSPPGKSVMGGRIIGVIQDFHFASLHSKIEPLMIYCGKDGYRYLMVKIEAGNMAETQRILQEIWSRINPGIPMEYEFLDEQFDRLYRSDLRVGKIVNTFSFLILFIACLGLYGLASFTLEQRTKEIGIRRVLGASIPEIFMLLTRGFTKWIIVSNVIAWPVAYYFMNNWLQNFAYRTNLSVWIFIFSSLAALAIALLTVSYQSIKAARANPVESLRYE
jgi:ABC-type antimicrobial peptide transport system permease subunit